MNNTALVKLTAPTAAEICRQTKLSSGALGRLQQRHTPAEYLGLLVQAQMYPDACRFLAHALPKKEAVWWACTCVRQSAEPASRAAVSALDAAERWLRDDTDENRRAAFTAAEAAAFGTPAGCAALAVFLSGGSLAPAHLPPVASKEHLTGEAVIGALMLAAVKPDPVQAPERQRKYLECGLEIARGGRPWAAKSPEARAAVP